MKLSVYIRHANGRLTFDAEEGHAPCMIWAEISTDPNDDTDFIYDAVYMESDFAVSLPPDFLMGQPRTDAIRLLEADAQWRDWAARHIVGKQREAYREAI